LEEKRRKLTEELERARAKRRDIALVEEENLRLKERVKQLDMYRQRCDELEAECAMLRKEKATW
jgi:hypothetical protein